MRTRVLVLALLIASALATGCAESTETAAPAQTVTVTVTEPTSPPPLEEALDDDEPVAGAPATTIFEGEHFAIEYPADWNVETAEVSKGSYLDTTIREVRNGDVMLRIDVTPGSFLSPATMASEVEAYLVDEPRYRRLRFSATTFKGYDAFRWDFVVEEDGVLLRKSDIFLATTEGDGVAILIQAPARMYRSRVAELEAARKSLVLAADYAGDEEYDYDRSDEADPSEFCETHDCIDNFEEGRGYVVQCADGTWSQSGGIQGACSHHGGVASSAGSPSLGDHVDDNGDGSSYNWCGASRDGDGDGLWCEGR